MDNVYLLGVEKLTMAISNFGGHVEAFTRAVYQLELAQAQQREWAQQFSDDFYNRLSREFPKDG